MLGGTFSIQTSNEQQSLTLLTKACATVLPCLGLSISPANPPNLPVPRPATTRSDSFSGWTRVLSSKTRRRHSVSVPFLQNPFNSTCPKKEQRAVISSFPTSFPTRFGRFWRLKHQIRQFLARFGGKSIRFGEIFVKSG